MSSLLPPSPSRVRSRARNLHGEPPVRHGQLTGSRPFTAAVRAVLVVVAVIAVSGASIVAFAAHDLASQVKPGIALAHVNGQKSVKIPDVSAIEGGVNLLLAGTDTRLNQGGAFANKKDQAASTGAGNNDVTMLLHISQDHTNATVVSFPRDMMVTVPACGKQGSATNVMFNTTLARGGLGCTVRTVESLTGLTIPFAAEISFDGVIGMSNAIGGVAVCLASPVKDPYVGLNLPAGNITLQGTQALAFVRSRHGVGDGSDLGRISNQQVFLSALMRSITSENVLNNPVTLFKIANAALKNMTLSDTLTNPTTLVSIAVAAKSIPLARIAFVQYPTLADPANANRVVAQASSAMVLNGALRADSPVILTGKVGRAAVVAPTAAVPSTTTPPTPVAPSSAPVPAATAPDAEVPTDNAVQLPTGVTGQNAAQQTCTAGNR